MDNKVKTTETHKRTHFLRIEQEAIERILANHLAERLGLMIGGKVDYRTLMTSRDTSTGIEKYAEVTITEDLGEA